MASEIDLAAQEPCGDKPSQTEKVRKALACQQEVWHSSVVGRGGVSVLTLSFKTVWLDTLNYKLTGERPLARWALG